MAIKSRGNDDGAEFIRLQCGVQHYAWGDLYFIPSLLGSSNEHKKPFAELWIGAHPDLPSQAVLEQELAPLNRLIEADPEGILHQAVASRFGGQLPFLLKLLAAASPLSLQVHPSKAAAEEGFARENEAGVPADDARRNYRDRNHKPELIVALTDFYGLRGFRPLRDIESTLKTVPELRDIAIRFEPHPESLRRIYSQFMTWPQEKVDELLRPLVARLESDDRRKPFSKSDPEYWALRADRAYSRDGHHDRGLLSVYLLNLIKLHPGEGIYLPAGILHAYLEGAGIEIMANSNNVLRGGWTPKHVDVPELLRNMTFEGGDPEIIAGRRVESTPEWRYDTPAPEFQLSRIELDPHTFHRCAEDHAVDILLAPAAPEGSTVTLRTNGGTAKFASGGVFLIRAGMPYELAADGRVTLFKATVPLLPSKPLSFRGRQPGQLAFGTSGLRGLVTDITDLEAYINTRGFLDYASQTGDIKPGSPVSIACDLRPSSDSADRSILRAVAQAVEDTGLAVDNLGRLPTPALTYYAMQQNRPGIMVTGSHIPFDRNGIKFSKSAGEVLKADEAPILEAVRRIREAEYTRPETDSIFAENRMFADRHRQSSLPVNPQARDLYLRRYLDFFPPNALQGLRVVFYQHSAVGRDVLLELLTALGAKAIPMGRSESFVPIDTEAISEDKLKLLQELADDAARTHGPIDAVISTDGDSDRPLVAGVAADGRVTFFGGDILGIVVAEFLNSDAVVVPISSNDAVDQWANARGITVRKTRIGSPYVIEEMQRHRAASGGRVVGWEANGGFLTGTDIERGGRLLKALPTRDAALPLLAVLCSANEQQVSLEDLFRRLPRRFSKAGLLDNFPPEISRALLRRFSGGDDAIQEVEFAETGVRLHSATGKSEKAGAGQTASWNMIREELEQFFGPNDGFSGVKRINTLDGVRVFFEGGDIVHVRPSGNAPQLRAYAVANTPERAAQIVECALREPDGILRRLEAMVAETWNKRS